MIEYYETDERTGLMTAAVYWEMREITFSKSQIKWLLGHLPMLSEGKYPLKPVGYINCEVRTENNGDAGYCRPCEISAEIKARIEQCGEDGLITLAYYTWGMSIIELMHYVHKTETLTWYKITRCLRYISGKTRKNYSYPEFILSRN